MPGGAGGEHFEAEINAGWEDDVCDGTAITVCIMDMKCDESVFKKGSCMSGSLWAVVLVCFRTVDGHDTDACCCFNGS